MEEVSLLEEPIFFSNELQQFNESLASLHHSTSEGFRIHSTLLTNPSAKRQKGQLDYHEINKESFIKPIQHSPCDDLAHKPSSQILHLCKPNGIVGMQLYSPFSLYIQGLCDFKSQSIQNDFFISPFSHKLDPVEHSWHDSSSLIKDEKIYIPMVSCTQHTAVQEENVFSVRISGPTCKFNASTRELNVMWTENNNLRIKKFSCKKLGKQVVYQKAKAFMFQLAMLALKNSFYTENDKYDILESTRASCDLPPVIGSKLPSYFSQIEQVVYHYDGPLQPLLIYKKKLRIWTVEWVTPDKIHHTTHWSCKKLGKLQAVSRAEKFVNMISKGIISPHQRVTSCLLKKKITTSLPSHQNVKKCLSNY